MVSYWRGDDIFALNPDRAQDQCQIVTQHHYSEGIMKKRKCIPDPKLLKRSGSIEIRWMEDPDRAHVPYGADHSSGRSNNGYYDLKLEPSLIERVHEADIPELRRFLEVLNAPNSFFRTLKLMYAACPDLDWPPFTHKLVSRTDLAFEVIDLNKEKLAFSQLFQEFRIWCKRVKLGHSIGVQFEVQRTTYHELGQVGWSVGLWNLGYGFSPVDARAEWAKGLVALQDFLEFTGSRNQEMLQSKATMLQRARARDSEAVYA